MMVSVTMFCVCWSGQYGFDVYLKLLTLPKYLLHFDISTIFVSFTWGVETVKLVSHCVSVSCLVVTQQSFYNLHIFLPLTCGNKRKMGIEIRQGRGDEVLVVEVGIKRGREKYCGRVEGKEKGEGGGGRDKKKVKN